MSAYHQSVTHHLDDKHMVLQYDRYAVVGAPYASITTRGDNKSTFAAAYGHICIDNGANASQICVATEIPLQIDHTS